MNKANNVAMYFDGNGGYEKTIKAYTSALKAIADIALKTRASDETFMLMISGIPETPHTDVSNVNIDMPVHHHYADSDAEGDVVTAGTEEFEFKTEDE